MRFIRCVVAAALLPLVSPLGINGKTRHSRHLKTGKNDKKKHDKKKHDKKKHNKKSAKNFSESNETTESIETGKLVLLVESQIVEEDASFDCEKNSFLEYYNAEKDYSETFDDLEAGRVIGVLLKSVASNEQAKDAMIQVLLEIGSDVGFDCEFDEIFSTTSALEKAREECVADLTALLGDLNDCDLKAGFVNAVAADRFVSSVLWPSTSANAALAADLAAAISNGPVSVSIEADSDIFVGACEENNYPSFVEFADKLGLLEGILGDKFYVNAFEYYEAGVSLAEDNVFLSEQQYVDENPFVVNVDVNAELNAKAKEALIGFILNSGPDIEPCGFEGDFSCGEWNEEEFESNEEEFELFDRLDDCVLKAGLEKVVAAALFFASLLEG